MHFHIKCIIFASLIDNLGLSVLVVSLLKDTMTDVDGVGCELLVFCHQITSSSI